MAPSWRSSPRAVTRARSLRLMNRLRLANLSYAQLLEFAVQACESSSDLKNKADALIAKVAPLPLWCVDVLLSPDLLPQLFSLFGLSEHAAAGVCTTWSHAYSRQLRRCRYVDPRRVRQLAYVPNKPTGLCMLPGGVAGDRLVRKWQQKHHKVRRCAQRFRPASPGGLPGQQSRRTAFRVADGPGTHQRWTPDVQPRSNHRIVQVC